MLSQLSYTPFGSVKREGGSVSHHPSLFKLLTVGVPELESGTSSLSATRSNQLSYTPVLPPVSTANERVTKFRHFQWLVKACSATTRGRPQKIWSQLKKNTAAAA